MNNYLKEINEGQGFISLPKINNEQIEFILSSIEIQLENIINENISNFLKPKNLSIFNSYNLIDNNIWSNLFNKKNRSLNKNSSIKISNYFESYLKDNLESDIEFSDDLDLGYPCFSFRIVRPNEPNDVGPLHADQWFIDIGAQPLRVPKVKSQLIKFWIPIDVDHYTSNLLVVPYSHIKNDKYKYDKIFTKNGIKPSISEKILPEEILMIDNKNGNPILFNMNLIHGGAINKAANCRVSLEFEFFLSIK